MEINRSTTQLGLFSLLMINVIAVISIRSLPFGALMGGQIIWWYLIAGVFFLIPVALCSAYLCRELPESQGLYDWLLPGLGQRWAFWAVCIQWLYNMIWLPTLLALLSTALAYAIGKPILGQQLQFMLPALVIITLLATLINYRGLGSAAHWSNATALLGTLIPFIGIMIASVYLIHGHHVVSQLAASDWNLNATPKASLALLPSLVFNMIGIEMSGVHSRSFQKRPYLYPLCLTVSVLLILVSLIGGSLAVSSVIPKDKLHLLSGFFDAFGYYFHLLDLPHGLNILALSVWFGGLGSVAAWLLGAGKILAVGLQPYRASYDISHLDQDVPRKFLVYQGILCAFCCALYVVLPSIQSAFWFLSDVAAMLALTIYLLLFWGTYRMLRQQKQTKHWLYQLFGLYLLLAFLFTLAACCAGLIPPSQQLLGQQSLSAYLLKLVLGLVIVALIPVWLHKQLLRQRDR